MHNFHAALNILNKMGVFISKQSKSVFVRFHKPKCYQNISNIGRVYKSKHLALTKELIHKLRVSSQTGYIHLGQYEIFEI